MDIIIFLALFLLGLFVLGMIFLWSKEVFIRKQRKGESKEAFVKYFIEQGVPESITISVYHYLQDWMIFKGFPVKPDDDIGKIYGIVDDDLDDFIKEIIESNNLKMPVNHYWSKSVVTVEDLILFVNSLSTKES